MLLQLDVGKLVGAASAPVALIISASICLGTLGAKYSMLVGIFRECTSEYRKIEDPEDIRGRSLQSQIEHYSSRLRLLMRGTLYLSLAIHSFILTVLCTSMGVLFPKAPAWTWITGFFSFTGLFLLAGFVVIEMIENHRAKSALILETAEFPNVLASDHAEQSKASFAAESKR